MVLKISNLNKSFTKVGTSEKIILFESMDFSLNAGQTVAIVGRSGSGKSTLLGMIAGIDRDFSGQIDFKGKNIKNLSEQEITTLRALEIGIVFQQYHLLEHLTALENVMLPLEILKIAKAEEKAKALLKKVGLQGRYQHFPALLSGGEKQRVAIARAVIVRRSLILADEPTGSLDEKNGDLIIELFFELVALNRSALVIVTHSLDIAKRAQSIAQIKQGRLDLV